MSPSVFEWLGGTEALNRLTQHFYAKVSNDRLLAPVFAQMPPTHPAHVAAFVGEVFGGPPRYSEQKGAMAHRDMMIRHQGRHLTEEQRHRWMELLIETADELGLPKDPEFRSIFVGYLEWGSRIAVEVSQTTEPLEDPGPMPKWGWGPGGEPRPS